MIGDGLGKVEKMRQYVRDALGYRWGRHSELYLNVILSSREKYIEVISATLSSAPIKDDIWKWADEERTRALKGYRYKVYWKYIPGIVSGVLSGVFIGLILWLMLGK